MRFRRVRRFAEQRNAEISEIHCFVRCTARRAVALTKSERHGAPEPPLSASPRLPAEALGIRIEVLQARNNDEMEKLFGAWTGQQGNALIVTPHPFYISVRPRLIELANSHAISTIYPFYEDAVAGGLMSYGNSNFDIYRQMAAYTARIFDGERLGDLPIMQPAKISLTINMKTAKELGLTVPRSLLTRADKVMT
jgi:putative ABC transport system substrate-binding protein